MRTVQLRSTIFLPQNIGYTPESAEKFANLLMPDSRAYSIVQPGMSMLGVNPNAPQYGMPWRLFKKSGTGEYNIAFQPGKIDIVLAKEVLCDDAFEKSFCDECIHYFSKILESLSPSSPSVVTRIAYAPLYAITQDDPLFQSLWANLLKKTLYNGNQIQDTNLSFLLKGILKFGGKEVQMNFLHNIFDGNQIKSEGSSQIVRKVILFQLDLNSIPESNLNMDTQGVADFFSTILSVKNNLVANVTE